VDEETFNQFNSKERAPPGDPFEAYSGDDYFGVGVENGRREERARPAGEEIGLEDADDGEFIEALPDAAGQDQRPRDGRRERQAGTSDRRRGRDGNRGGTKSRRKGGREKPRRPKASGPPGERGEGVIRALNSERGFGFIETPTGDIFFHKSGVREDFTLLSIGARVAFVFGQGDNGIKAEDVAVLG
jgi:cold shock CspA family protein